MGYTKAIYGLLTHLMDPAAPVVLFQVMVLRWQLRYLPESSRRAANQSGGLGLGSAALLVDD